MSSAVPLRPLAGDGVYFFLFLSLVGVVTIPLAELSLMFFLLTDFFFKYAVAVMTVRELFEFVTDPSITPENMDAYLEKVGWAEERRKYGLPLCTHLRDSGCLV